MFKPVFPESKELVTVFFEDVPYKVPADITVAAAALKVGMRHTRETHKGDERAPFCHMGICHECLMEIDGVPNQQACLIPVREGQRVRRQISVPSFVPENKG